MTWRQVSWKELPYREHSWQHDRMMQVYGEQLARHGTAGACCAMPQQKQQQHSMHSMVDC